ncbi:MAG: class I SAM-dependent methyltransferase [Chlamydiota bacterium]
MTYALIDSGFSEKLERFGDYLIIRPCAQALWTPILPKSVWQDAHALFTRDEGNKWQIRKKLPHEWIAKIEGVKFKIAPTDFGHLGVFPEHSLFWEWMKPFIQKRGAPNILNLFAYSGGATLAAAAVGAKVCHLDASKGMVAWARENAALNGLEKASIRWIIDDVMKFLMREKKRGSYYDGIILDPPSFGRGNQGEIFKIERDIIPLLKACKELLTEKPLFLIFSTHTPGMTPLVMHHLMDEMMQGGTIESGEMTIPHDKRPLPSGSYARWYVD